MSATRIHVWKIGVCLLVTTSANFAANDDTQLLKDLLRRANGRVASLEPGKVYVVSRKIELGRLCPSGVTILGNNATLRAGETFQHNALLTSTELLRSKPYKPGVVIRDLQIDGAGHVGRCVFGNWQNATIEHLSVRGATIYQVNALWHDSTLSHLRIDGNADQTNNGFDCNLQNSTVYDVTVDMHGNLKESGFWLNSARHADIVHARLIDGRTAFGLENCQDVNVVNLKVRGEFSFRAVNILAADPSERIRLYDIDLAHSHVGDAPSSAVHFNATRGGLVARGRIRGTGPGVLLSNGATSIDLVDISLPKRPLAPSKRWQQGRGNRWHSKQRIEGISLNRPPVVDAGPDQVVSGPNTSSKAIVADELPVARLKLKWARESGPGRVRFESPTNAVSDIRFSRPGEYKLTLTVSDGVHEAKDSVVYRVQR